MDSKEALKIIETYNYFNGAEEITGNICVNPVYLESKKHYQEAIDKIEKELLAKGELSDGYHTFNDLYYQRCILFATIVNTYSKLA